ncbi:hypothetical protein FQR65_LT16672 [Abscondita terminalis]|nr:hypothetical protein FQR65_LT16672 [Abscondita terminalis]
MIEPEVAFSDLSDNISLIQRLVKYVVGYLFENNLDELNFCDNNLEEGLINKLKIIKDSDFAINTYTEVIEILKNAVKNGVDFEEKNIEFGLDLGTEHERYICEVYNKKPTFVKDYPKEIKAFYMKENSDKKTVAAVDLLVPGIGELVGVKLQEEQQSNIDIKFGLYVVNINTETKKKLENEFEFHSHMGEFMPGKIDMDELEKEIEIITTDVPVRIIAGAGSGKTKVITTKVAYLIEQEKIRANKILCVTFTNKAANEMLINLINDTREMYEKNYDVQIIAEEMISKLEYFNLYDEKKPQDKEEIDYINSYLDQMRSFDEQFPKSEYKDMNKLDIFLQESNLDRNNDNKDIDNKVTLLTVHAAKGLENKIVFITGLSKGIFPSNLSSYKDELLEEERRAMYVAITRAEEKLFITYVSGEFSYVTNENLEPSMFINELNSNLIENSSTPIYINAPYIREEPKTINFKKSAELKDVLIGDKIEHVNFGLGMINKIVGRSMMVIFENPEYALKTVPINSSEELIMTSIKAIIIDEAGLHARPASIIAKEASKFTSEIKLLAGEKSANVKSIMNIMSLAIKTNTEITVEATGADEAEAIAAIEKAMKDSGII